ncbi:uvrD REP helicase, putative [Babesia caballi]|uniref:UvrD REP helicase, putative n=1 Tax=Babesia caballi TaxID=5871 RepID=A0AAV4LVZ4_BABCB|nr:uvrD REP helicase, putative [Babesia caballi]
MRYSEALGGVNRLQDARRGFETPSYVFLGPVYDEMLVAIADTDVPTAQKWLLAVSFVIKSEGARVEMGQAVPETASAFFDGVITKVLDMLEALEGKPSLIAEDMWRTLQEAFGLILDPGVAAVVKSHKRLANRAFKFVLATTNSAHAEKLVLLLLKWTCSTRTFESDKAEDATYLDQMRILQSSANEDVSREATGLMLNNLRKVAKKDARALPAFITANVKHVVKGGELGVAWDSFVAELELGTTEKLLRALQLLSAAFEGCKRGEAGVVIDLTPLWSMLEMLFEKIDECDVGTVKQALRLVVVAARWLGPDLVLVNVAHFGKVAATLFGHNVGTLRRHSEDIAALLEDMGELCPDFYLALTQPLKELVEELSREIDSGQLQQAHKLIAIVSQLNGPGVGHAVEGLILRLANVADSCWGEAALAGATMRLIRRHLTRGCSKHPKTLQVLLAFAHQVRAARGHDRLVDGTILAIGRMLADAGGPSEGAEYALYTQELQRYLDSVGERKAPAAREGGAAQPDAKRAVDAAKTKRDEVVDAIRKKLKSMRQPISG